MLFIRADPLHHRQFREILFSRELSAEDNIHHFTVCWLSHGEKTRRVLLLRKEIVEFYSMKSKDRLLLNKEFLTSLALLVHFLTRVNNLNRSFQGVAFLIQ